MFGEPLSLKAKISLLGLAVLGIFLLLLLGLIDWLEKLPVGGKVAVVILLFTALAGVIIFFGSK